MSVIVTAEDSGLMTEVNKKTSLNHAQKYQFGALSPHLSLSNHMIETDFLASVSQDN